MTLTFDRLTFHLSNSEEQLGNLYDIALSTLFSSPFGSVWVDLLSKFTIGLIDDLDLDKRGHFRWIYVCVLVRLIFTIQSSNINVTLKKCHNETATVYQFTGMILPNLQPAICKISILG